jgi:hypothetical protein
VAAQEGLRSRYGVGGSGEQAQRLGLAWFYGGYAPSVTAQPPEGTQATYLLPVSPALDAAQLATLVRAHPGNVWLIGNEPNVPPEANIAPTASAAPAAYADALAWYAATIKSLDPSARLAGPNVINWEFTCLGCPGYQPGREWTEQMRAVYLERYGAEPPFDVWGLHAYDLDWENLPNGNAQRQIDQILGLRGWLDAIPSLAGAPIWLTEVGIHWGYTGFEIREGNVYPTGVFDEAHVERYMRTLFGWLNEHAEALRVERWFLWYTYFDRPQQALTTWAGISLLDGPGPEASVTRLGQVYQELAGITAER